MQFNLWMCHCLDWCVYCSIFKIKLTVSMISRKGNFHFDKWTKTKIVENLRGTVSKFPYPQALICFLCACMQMIIRTRQRNTMVMIRFFLFSWRKLDYRNFWRGWWRPLTEDTLILLNQSQGKKSICL